MKGFYATLRNPTLVFVFETGCLVPVNYGFLCDVNKLLYCIYVIIKTFHTQIKKGFNDCFD